MKFSRGCRGHACDKDDSIRRTREEFEFLGNWQDQCRYLIELGEELPELTADEQTESYRVLGCQSRVWVVPSLVETQGERRVEIRAKSDARIVDGLIVVLLSLTQGKRPDEILAIDFHAKFAELGLESQLVPQRRNGLYAMVGRVQSYASDALTQSGASIGTKPATSTASHSIRFPHAETPSRLQLSEDSSIRRRTFDPELVRLEFPALNQILEHGLPVTYFDSGSSAEAATGAR